MEIFAGKTSCKKFSPHPFQELSNKGSIKIFFCPLTDSRRERIARFCSRKLPGAAETLVAKKVD